ncbi:MAG: hypothetical protein JNJ90_18455 [Saprospiraceae bacterium]|jgi:hypothetical protein|nr:hypothetical protein [Saprospiraceae bacterium]
MLRWIFPFVFLCFWLLQACEPPVRLKLTNGKTGLDSTFYAGVAEDARSIDLRKARLLAKVKVGDLGVTLDCRYHDVLGKATDRARKIGGNLLVITEHTRNTVKSNCHRIKGEVYLVPKLEGMEDRIWWHPLRQLFPGDLRGERDSFPAAGLPPVKVEITGRLGGDFYNEAIGRTETIFYCDSTYRPADPQRAAIALRRAQIYFDLAEWHARGLKEDLAAIGPDLPKLTDQIRPLTARRQEILRTALAEFELEFSAKNAPDALARWETRIKSELAGLEQYAGELVVDLRKKKKS